MIAMECYSRRSACIYCLICYSFGSRSRAYAKDGGRESPGVRVTFFRVAERKSPKKGRPYCARPFAARRATCDARTGAAPQNSLRATRSVQTTAASQSTKHGRSDAHATPQPPRRRRSQQGWGSRTANIPSGHRCARPSLRSARRLRPRDGAERSAAKQWPVWMSAPWVPFCACREAQGRGCVRVPKDTRTSCTDLPQLFERSA